MNEINLIEILESVGLFEQFCGTWIRGPRIDDVIRLLGADMSSESRCTMLELNAERWKIPHDQPVLLVGPLAETWTFVVEPQSYLGADPDRLGMLSSGGGQAINVHWTVNMASGFTLAQNGSITTSFSLTHAYTDREGTVPDHLDDELVAVGFSAVTRSFDQQAAAAFLLAGRLTGTVLSGDWFSTPHVRYLGHRRRRS